MKNLTHLSLLAGFLTIGPVYGQNTAFTYQGRVTANGAAFTGIGQFKFALVTGTNTSRQATATANPPSGGFITLINVTYGGSGYPAAPAVTITGGGGSGATASAVVSGGSVTSITVNNPGSGYTGIPTVTVAPPPANIAYSTYWSNDGTSFNGSEPAAAVNVSVASGLFTVVLGDTSLGNMGPISAGLFSQRDLQLRIWFNDGVSGSVALNPPQNLTPSPYAAFAHSASNLLGTVSAAQLTGSLPVSQLSGTLSLAQLPGAVLTNNEGSVTLSGAFSGNGSALTNIPLAGVNSAGTLSLLTNGLNFIISSTVAAGASPNSVVALDVNGDGKVDLISANQVSPGTLTVLTNNGIGGFGYNGTLNVGDFPTAVIAADINMDGKLDLISANQTSPGRLTILTNNSSGGFGSNATLILPDTPLAVVAGDLKGNGKPDLIISLQTSPGTVIVFTNNGSGSFGSNATLIVGPYPVGLTAADVNGDGKLDVITANITTPATLTLLTNNGSGGLGFNATLVVGNSPLSVLAADINGDGKVDLISANQTTPGTFTVLTNNGSGGFVLSATLNAGDPLTGAVAADVNGDGKVDLIGAGSLGTLTVLTNSSSGFGFALTLRVAPSPTSLLATEVNGDGKVDLISVHPYNNVLTVLTNVGGEVSLQIGVVGQAGGLRFLPGQALNVINGAAVNTVTPGVSGSVIAGGGSDGFTVAANLIQANVATIGGGLGNSILSGADFSVIAGGAYNTNTATYATVSGGSANSAGNAYATVGGGSANSAGNTYATVAGGSANTASGQYASVGGGSQNIASGHISTVAGGVRNTASGNSSAVVGGDGNSAAAIWSAVSGGYRNLAQGPGSVVAGGGYDGSIYWGNVASGGGSFVGSGVANTAPGYNSVASGGRDNHATNDYATVPGGAFNTAGGPFSFAAGFQAAALHPGAFVWADSQNAPFSSTANNQFLVRAAGGARFVCGGNWDVNNTEGDFRVGTDQYRLKIGIATAGGGSGDIWIRAQGGTGRIFLKTPGGFSIYSNEGQTAGVSLAAGSGSWSTLSDRQAKEHFSEIDPSDVLAKVAALPVRTWNYKTQDPSIRHIGPVAQEFHAAFNVGENDTTISTVDEGGVALAAIQGLNQKLEGELKAKDARIAELESRLNRLEKLVTGGGGSR